MQSLNILPLRRLRDEERSRVQVVVRARPMSGTRWHKRRRSLSALCKLVLNSCSFVPQRPRMDSCRASKSLTTARRCGPSRRHADSRPFARRAIGRSSCSPV